MYEEPFVDYILIKYSRELAACLGSINCPLDIKSYGSLILNLLHLLGVNNCHHDESNSSCPHDKRIIILHNLLTYWADDKVTNNADEHDGHSIETDSYCQ